MQKIIKIFLIALFFIPSFANADVLTDCPTQNVAGTVVCLANQHYVGSPGECVADSVINGIISGCIPPSQTYSCSSNSCVCTPAYPCSGCTVQVGCSPACAADQTCNQCTGVCSASVPQKVKWLTDQWVTEFTDDPVGGGEGKWDGLKPGDIYYNDGNVGIGTNSPSAKLEVDGDIHGVNMLLNGNIKIKGYQNVGGYLTVDGNVGIGTTSPATKFHIKDTGSVYALIENSTGNQSAIQFVDSLDTGEWVVGIHGGDANKFKIANSDVLQTNTVLTITESLNVGIGTTTPGAKLDVNGALNVNGTLNVNGNGYFNYVFASKSSGGMASYFGATGGINNVGVRGYTSGGSTSNKAGSFYAVGGGGATNYGVYSEVHRSDGSTHYSGYFFDSGSGGIYNGLYADYRTGDSIDIAEYIYDRYQNTEPGDVLIVAPDSEETVMKSNKAFDTSVIGIVTTNPHLVIGADLVDSQENSLDEDRGVTKIALTGRVPVKVTDENGPIKPGDYLTTSSKEGYAMKWSLLDLSDVKDFEELKVVIAENERRSKAIVAKALGTLDSAEGVVIALVASQ